MKKETILVIDDNLEILESLKRILTVEGYQVSYAADGQAGLNLAIQLQPDLILLDMKLPNLDGLELIETLRREKCTSPVIFMTAFGSEQIAVKAFRLGVCDYLSKPFSAQEVRQVLSRVMGEKRLAREHEDHAHNQIAAETVRMTAITLSHYLNNYLMALDANLDLLQEALQQNPDEHLLEIVSRSKASARSIQAVIKVLHQTTDIQRTPYTGSTSIIDLEQALRKELGQLPEEGPGN